MARAWPRLDSPIKMSKSGRLLAAGFGDQRLEAFQNRCKVVQTGAKWCNVEWAVSITGLVVIVVPAEDDTAAVFSLAVNTDTLTRARTVVGDLSLERIRGGEQKWR